MLVVKNAVICNLEKRKTAIAKATILFSFNRIAITNDVPSRKEVKNFGGWSAKRKKLESYGLRSL